MKELTQEWIAKTEKDFLVSNREFTASPPEFDTVCFHAQQCLEKLFKAMLQENDVPFQKTHDLDYLLEKCKPFLPILTSLK